MLLTTSIRRIYDNPKENSRDFRILVDRRWSRGLSNDEVKVDLWQKEMAPSNSLRKWSEFKRRYFNELDKNIDRYTEEHTNYGKDKHEIPSYI
jgi:uncharacterized protein YeaO (DUF488 family)